MLYGHVLSQQSVEGVLGFDSQLGRGHEVRAHLWNGIYATYEDLHLLWKAL